MANQEGNIPAFSRPASFRPDGRSIPGQGSGQSGMSLRDWFAGQALAAMAKLEVDPNNDNDIATKAYAVADAMLKARRD